MVKPTVQMDLGPGHKGKKENLYFITFCSKIFIKFRKQQMTENRLTECIYSILSKPLQKDEQKSKKKVL